MEFDLRLTNKPPRFANDRLHFFKYCSADVAKLILRNRTLRWSTPQTLNDPFDVQFDMGIKVTKEEMRDPALEKLWAVYSGHSAAPVVGLLGVLMSKLASVTIRLSKDQFLEAFAPAIEEGYDRALESLPRLHRETADILADVKLLCLSAEPDVNLMWAHYSDSHRGVVLRFRSIPGLDNPYGMAKPVNYVDQIPELFGKEFMIDMFAGLASIDTATIMDKLIYTKSSDWSYEKEWRINAGSGRDASAPFELVPFGTNDIDGVIFGLRSSDGDRAEITQLVQGYPNVELFQARRERSNFALSIDQA
jgi:hypothetical protein